MVHKQQFPKPPAPPEIILPWINHQALKRAAAEIPKLRPTMMEPDPEVEIGEGEEPPLLFPERNERAVRGFNRGCTSE